MDWLESLPFLEDCTVIFYLVLLIALFLLMLIILLALGGQFISDHFQVAQIIEVQLYLCILVLRILILQWWRITVHEISESTLVIFG